MDENNAKGSEFLEQSLESQGAIDAALRPPPLMISLVKGKLWIV